MFLTPIPLGSHVIPLPGSSKESRTLDNFASANVVFTDAEKKELDDLITTFKVVGGRYPAPAEAHLMK